jgi:hypothetical protein
VCTVLEELVQKGVARRIEHIAATLQFIHMTSTDGAKLQRVRRRWAIEGLWLTIGGVYTIDQIVALKQSLSALSNATQNNVRIN